MRENLIFQSGYALVSAWVALIRLENNPWQTLAVRFFACFGVPFVLALTLWERPTFDQSFGIAAFLLALAIPTVLVSYLFGYFRGLIGTRPYVVLLVLASGVYVTSFAAYLRS